MMRRTVMREAIFSAILLALLSGCVQQELEESGIAAPADAMAVPEQGWDQTVPPAETAEEIVDGNITSPLPRQDQPAPPPENRTRQAEESPPEEKPNIPEGIRFGGGAYVLMLDDVSVVPVSTEPCGIFSVRDSADGSILDRMMVCPAKSQNWAGPDGRSYRIFVVKVAAGYGGHANWANVIIYG